MTPQDVGLLTCLGPPLFLVWFVGYWVWLGQPLIGLVFGSITGIANGAVQSRRLDNRRDAAATAEWTPARHVTPHN